MSAVPRRRRRHEVLGLVRRVRRDAPVNAADILRLPPLPRQPAEYLVLAIPLSEENVVRMLTRRKPLYVRCWVTAAVYRAMRPPFIVLQER